MNTGRKIRSPGSTWSRGVGLRVKRADWRKEHRRRTLPGLRESARLFNEAFDEVFLAKRPWLRAEWETAGFFQ